jgi:hypothetical protein
MNRPQSDLPQAWQAYGRRVVGRVPSRSGFGQARRKKAPDQGTRLQPRPNAGEILLQPAHNPDLIHSTETMNQAYGRNPGTI